MTAEELTEQILLIQDCKKTSFSEREIKYLQQELSKVPEHIVLAAFSHFLHSDEFYTTSKLFARITEIAEQDPNLNPAKQWDVVFEQYERGNLGNLKIIFDNVRTNLAIELMGGQKRLIQRLNDGGKYASEKVREEFMENFRKALIPNNVSWKDWKIDFDSGCVAEQEKGRVYLVGCQGKRLIPETEVNLALTISREERLLTQGVKTSG